MEWFLRASDDGDTTAMRNISDYSIEQDYGNANEWFLKASYGVSTEAILKIGGLYRDGGGMKL